MSVGRVDASAREALAGATSVGDTSSERRVGTSRAPWTRSTSTPGTTAMPFRIAASSS